MSEETLNTFALERGRRECVSLTVWDDFKMLWMKPKLHPPFYGNMTVQLTDTRYAPHSLCLESSARLNVTSTETLSTLFELGGDNFKNTVFILQSGITNQKSDVVVEEVVGTEQFGGNIINALDQDVVTSIPKDLTTLDSLYRRPNQDGVLHDVKQFLSRPFLLDSGSLAATDGPYTFTTFGCFTAMRLSNMFTSKLRGAYLVRATTHFTLQINANRMQMGRYLLCYMPTGGMVQTGVDYLAFYEMHRYSRVECTQLRHINMDVNCDTQGVVTIPYSGNTSGWMFNTAPGTDIGDPGVIFMYPYVPLQSAAGSTTATYQLFVHYTDIQIDGVGVAQSGFTSTIKRKKDMLAEEAITTRPISTILSSLSSVSSNLSNIPLLSSMMTASKVVTDALANAAYTMGWSKPINMSIAHRVRKEQFPYLAVSDAHDTSDTLALTLGNSVGIISGFGNTDKDELSIDYLKSIQAFYAQYTWTQALASGTQIFNLAVSPDVNVGSSDTQNTLYSWPPIAYLARLFCYWRGSIVYTFKFTKTEFHSGRLMVRFIPYDNITYTYPGITTNNKPYMLKAIIDIRECNEFSVTVPFIAQKHWLDRDPTYGVTGSLVLEVLDPLVSPATVPSTIYISLEVSGGKDLEFAVPASGIIGVARDPVSDLWPTKPFTLQSGFSATKTIDGRSECSLGDVVIGGAEVKNSNVHNSAACHGEVYSSLRPLLKRGAPWFKRVMKDATNYARICPRGLSYGVSSIAGSIVGNPAKDYINNISQAFHSMRGGVRIRGVSLFGGTIPDHTAIATLHTRGYQNTQPATEFVLGSITAATFFDNAANGACSVTQLREGGLSIQVPQYNRTPAYTVGDNILNTAWQPVRTLRDPVEVSVIVVGAEGAGTSIPDIYFYRSAADDFNLAGFVSFPCTTLV